MIQACLNGDRQGAGIPVTPEELANDAASARDAGAACFHVHPRDEKGEETLSPEDVALALEAIRRAVPGLPVGIGSGAWIKPGGRQRHDHVKRWSTLPDYVSVNFNEEDALDLISLLAEMGVMFEAGIWDLKDCRRFLDHTPFNNCVRILIEMNEQNPADAVAEANAILTLLEEQSVKKPVLLHGLDATTWPCIELAAKLGHDTRIGYEDTLFLPDGTPATNAELVAHAVKIFESADR